ncbi:fibroblast growth factor 1-like [Meleagris gallopavo]|uniref:fibroblast growth factor 1-like n=1 Tax=Meleagris gallopavo TaxID=9103 RepID=UPI000549AF79|nr:fibroblast growth factor 1-like [Meleagris gallopavo]
MAEGEITTFTALTERFGLPLGNYKKPKLLYCSNGGHFLRILPDGKVDGTRDRSDQHSKDRPGCLALLRVCMPCIAWSALPAEATWHGCAGGCAAGRGSQKGC